MKRFSNIVVFALCMVLFAASAAFAFGEIRYPDRPLNLRDGRSANAKWVGSLYPGQKVKVAFLQDGWIAIFEPNETRATEAAAVGYSNAKYLLPKQTRVEPKPWGELVYTPRKLNIRSKPSTSGKKLDQLKVNEQVRIDFPDDDWAMVFSPKATIRSKMNARGHSSTKYFLPVTGSASAQPVVVATKTASSTPQPVAKPAPAPQPKPAVNKIPSTSWGTVITVKRKVNIRKDRTTSSRYVRTLKPGEEVRVDFLKNGWYAVFAANEPLRRENRAMGYALQSLLEGKPTSSKAVATTSKPVAPAPTAPTAAASTSTAGTKKTMVIDKSRFKPTKRPDPTPNKSAHGYQYRLLEKSETKKYGESWITVRVFLSTTKLPGTAALNDFAASIWKEHKRMGKNLVVLVYLPGMDTDDLAYGVVQFNDERQIESWVRKTTLFGTDFL